MKLTADGSYTIDDELRIAGEGPSSFVFGRGWLLEIVELHDGEFYFFPDGNEARPAESRFGVFYPPFSIIASFVRWPIGKVRGIGATESLAELPTKPLLFETEYDRPFESVAQAAEVLASARDVRPIEINSSPSLLSVKGKRLIDENFLIFPSIARIARCLGVTHPHLSRQFKRDYDMSPSSYLHQLRVAESTFRMATGEPIIDVSMDVGYNDLSRFYKHFNKVTQTSPAVCREMLKSRDNESISKNAKTAELSGVKITS
jgi:AraC-like DNA-binding protein